jgi:hypothetical protein
VRGGRIDVRTSTLFSLHCLALDFPMMNKILVLFLVTSLVACSGSTTDYKTKVQDPDVLHRSVKKITDIIVYDIFSPPVASRIYTYTSVAAYEALISQDKSYLSMAGQLHGLTAVPQPDPGMEYCFPLASATAILKVGRALVFSENDVDQFSKEIQQQFHDKGVPEDVFERSVVYGGKVADHILAWASKDNYKQTRSFPKYTITNDPYSWKPTPPAYMDAVEPHWNKIRTFVMDSAQQFKPAPATKFSSQKGSEFYAMANEVYETGNKMTDEQRSIASFWDCNPFVMNVKGHVSFSTKKISPGGHWMNITRVACNTVKADILHSAEAYLRVSLSLADGFISCWDEKYRSKLIRPETYINQYIDENWVPLLQTPPFPEYSSGHSVISASAAVALTGIFGDHVAYIDSTEVEFGMPARHFTSFVQASEEAAVSRLYGGIHYRPACDYGKLQGRAIGNFVAGKIRTKFSSAPVAK